MHNFEINKESPVPLHEQLLNELRRLVLAGQLKPHTPVISETKLAATLNISRTTIRQAWQAAEAEGMLYRVHGKGTYVAEPAATRTGRLVGFLIPNFRSTFDSQLLSGAEAYLRGRGYRVLFAHTDRIVEEENRLMGEMVQEGVIGFLLWPAMAAQGKRFLQEIERPIPTVFLDRPIPNLDYPCVAADHFRGGISAVEHLIALGHTRIAFVSRPHMRLWPIAERLRAYQEAMTAAGLKPLPPILVGSTTELGTRYAQKSYVESRGHEITQLQTLLGQPDRPSALFAMNDLMALQVIRAANLAGVKVPDELSLVGFDDLEIVSHVEPPLTTVAQDPFSIGAMAARCLLDMTEGKAPATSLMLLPTRLIIRESTAPILERKGHIQS